MGVKKLQMTTKAAIARINRALRKDDMVLKKARSERMRLDVGNYFVVNTRINGIMQHYKDVDPETLGRELGVINKWERVVD